MEHTACARLSRSGPRAVTTAIIQLDSGDVIRAKDRLTMARQMSKRRESRTSTSIRGEASTSHVGTETAEVSDGPSEFMQEAGGVPIYKESQVDENSSQLAKIARRASLTNANEAATEHAIPGIRQIQSEDISESTTDIKEANHQARDRAAPLSALEVSRIDSPPAAIDSHVKPPQSSPKHNSGSKIVRNSDARSKVTRRNPSKPQPSSRTSLERFRPRRSARKTSTSHQKAEVDWSEDIRPTDDDESPEKAKGASKKTSVSSPVAEVNKCSNKKRKAPQVKPDLGKRQKAVKENGRINARLPMTTDTRAKLQSGNVDANANSASNIHDEQLDNASTREALNLPLASFPIFAKEDADEPEIIDQRDEIIELSSDSLRSSNLSAPGEDIDLPKGNRQEAKATCHRRGFTVGQKIADALREAGLNPQGYPAVESRFSSTLMPAATTASKVPKDHLALQARVHPPQNPFSPELDWEQDEASAPSTAGGQKSHSSQDRVQIADTYKQRTINMFAEAPVLPAQGSPDQQKLLQSNGLLKRRGSGDQADDPMEIPDDSSQATYSPGAMAMDSIQPLDAFQGNPQAALQCLESELDTPLQSWEVPIIDDITVLPIQASESEKTPESQRPFLSVHTRVQKTASLEVSKSIQRKSVVDRNGSPRLCPQEAVESSFDIDRFFLQSIRIADSSSSENSEDSDFYSESKCHTERTWSKFQRDMFIEYGIAPEELTPGVTEPRLGSDGFNIDSRASPLSAATSEDDTELHQDVSHDDIGPSIAPSFVPRSIDDPKMEAEAETNQRRRSMENSGSTSHHLLMHGNLASMDWISDLESAQQNAHSLLLETNQHLSIQLAAEKDTIRKVLQIYRKGCNRILDDLSRAQEARMQLYRQQMSSVKEQHAQICQELIQGLQELDHRVQQGP
ncbi:hypothetical protein PMG11_02893 [Penicillium brasilianum]|uniref:Uncharacterized protein n=1 Tax=Penicillium brasilianum TaxID=104259 RepID=A0A0F7TIX9_PENBI|nr:hypothetical protein PMG11_02893 [Penicillium brasilianum]